eukprot:CAMPEP_0198217278 /NCGR_PEP_ID=MMETSP1445-20131203/62620_1 /TAXON_ID=36898 /ORGANISM="Pyramimonas sp., Strain CCMP2087" /LENGTH=330 /DNA_ID=CAMNT_0043893889 /DNA_START=40 /DNA_END=1032 /DNA_ORIENTATION=-
MRRSLRFNNGVKPSGLVWSISCTIIATLLIFLEVVNGLNASLAVNGAGISDSVEEYAEFSLHRRVSPHCGSHAVVLSGSIASFDRHYAGFKAKVLDISKEARADIFAHVYSNATSPEHRKAVHLLSSNHNVKGLVVETWNTRVVDSILRYFGENWTCYLGATAGVPVPGGRDPADYTMRVLSNFRKMYLAHEMQRRFRTEHGCDYSYVLRLRLDISHASDLRVPAPLKRGTVYVPDTVYFKTNLSEPLNDQMALGSPEDMDSLMSFYPKMPSLCREMGVTHPETLLRNALNLANLHADYLDHEYELDSAREQLQAVVDPLVLVETAASTR